jgi:hypothetical protein
MQTVIHSTPPHTLPSHAFTAGEEARYAELQLLALDLARSGETTVLGSMIEAGLPVNLSDHKGNSLLMLAAYHGNEETTAMLLGHGAEVDRVNDRGQTPLGGVAFKGHLGVARLLLASGADPNADNGGGKSPLMFAAMFGHREMMELLIEAGADTKSQTLMGINARHLARMTGAIRKVAGFFR